MYGEMDRVVRKEETGKAKRFMDVVKYDMAEVELTAEDTEYGNNWRGKISCGDP